MLGYSLLISLRHKSKTSHFSSYAMISLVDLFSGRVGDIRPTRLRDGFIQWACLRNMAATPTGRAAELTMDLHQTNTAI